MKNIARVTGHEPWQYQLSLTDYSASDAQKWVLIGRGSHICSPMYVNSVLSVTWRSAGAPSTDCFMEDGSQHLGHSRIPSQDWDVRRSARPARQQARSLR